MIQGPISIIELEIATDRSLYYLEAGAAEARERMEEHLRFLEKAGDITGALYLRSAIGTMGALLDAAREAKIDMINESLSPQPPEPPQSPQPDSQSGTQNPLQPPAED